jgi:hypothetical protein
MKNAIEEYAKQFGTGSFLLPGTRHHHINSFFRSTWDGGSINLTSANII